MTARSGLVEFDRGRIEQLLSRLAARLRARGVAASVYLVGGAAIAMTLLDSLRTHDIDAVVSDEAVLDEAATLAGEEGLSPSWLNQNARPWIPPRPEAAMVRPTEPGLVVHIASKEHLLAMKLVAMRRQDAPDIVVLAIALGMAHDDAASFADLLVQVYDGEDSLQQMLGVPHHRVEEEAQRRGEAAVTLLARAAQSHEPRS